MTFPGTTEASRTMPNPHPGPEQVYQNTEAARSVVNKMADMLEGLPSTDIAVPRSEWTVGEHGAHIAFANIGFGMFAMGLEYPHGDGTRAGLAEANDIALVGFPERDGMALAQHLRTAVETFIAAVRAASPDEEVPSPLGWMPRGTLSSYFLIHNLMHGCAISSGLNKDFPFEPQHLQLVWPLIVHAFPSFVRADAARGVTGTVRVSAPGAFEGAFQMESSQLTVLPAPTGPVDCLVESEPTHLFLVMIKILTVQEAVDLGHMKVSGANPELFGRMMNAIEVP
ncbi:MAG TPA: hypothetical protein VHJ78_01035 [Actinomycetota bacterium]|nr:hypothetical protein [Actinomycetota bacterium]